MSSPPQLTDAQRSAALEKAAEARRVRSELKSQLKLGTITLSELLEQAEKDPIIAKTKVLTVLESLPGVGKVAARRTMEELSIAESKRLGGLGSNQRAGLQEMFS